MTAPLTLEPLSQAHLPEVSALWADPAVIRYTNITAPCTVAEAAERLDRLLACQRGLPAPAVFAVREGAIFRGLAGCPPVDASAGTYGLFYQLLPAGDGAWALPPRRRRISSALRPSSSSP